MKLRNVFALFLLLILLQNTSSAQTCVSPVNKVVYYDTLTGSGNGLNTVSFPKFDPMLGTLTQVNISLQISILYNFQLENGEAVNINNYRVRVTRDDEIASSALMSNFFNTYSKTYGSYRLTASDGIAGSGTDFISVGPTYVMNKQTVTQSYYNTADFLGQGTVDFDYTTTTYSAVLGSVNNNFNSIATDTVIFKLEYVLCPTWFLKAELGAFNAQLADNRKVHLMWSAKNEEADRHYQLQYSYDGRQYFNLNERPSLPVTGGESRYLFDHFLPDTYHGKTVLYRIKVVENDGKEKYSETRVVALREIGSAAISLLPNPAKDRVQIVFNGQVRSNWKLELFNPTGMLIRTLQVKNASGVELGNLAALQKGLYTVRCTDLLSSRSYTERLVLQ